MCISNSLVYIYLITSFPYRRYVGKLSQDHPEVGRVIDDLRAVDAKGLALMDGHITVAFRPKPDRFAQLLDATKGAAAAVAAIARTATMAMPMRPMTSH